jgi:hypothetical protein
MRNMFICKNCGRVLEISRIGCVEGENRWCKTCSEDPVSHPKHYTSHPSGIEVIAITRHMNFNLGNVIKYVLRCDLKGKSVEDLKKARFYLNDEIKKREE